MWLFDTLPIFRALLGVGYTLAFFLAVCLGFLFVREKQWGFFLQAGGIALGCYGMLQEICEAVFWQTDRDLTPVLRWPVALVLALLAVFVGWGLLLLKLHGHWRRTHLSVRSIKEGMDQLPFGICFYYEGGLVKLCNFAMEQICLELSGGPLQDGEAFWDSLRARNMEAQELLGGNRLSVVRLADGRIHSFRNTRHVQGKYVLYELVSTDVTQEYGQNQRLEEKERELKRQAKQLKKLGQTIVEATEEQEILNAKIRLHSDFGNALLLAKRYLLLPEEGMKNQLIEAWSGCSRLIRKGEGQEHRDAYHAVFLAARDVGVQMILDGELPQGAERERLVAMAIGECLTNTFRHAGGDTLYVSTIKKEDEIVVCLWNNGKPPEGEISETGGLADLRRVAQKQGVDMTVTSLPRFKLELRFGEGYGL